MQADEAKFHQAVEMIRCAYINAENIKAMGVGFVPFVKTQINDALELLGEPKMED